MSKIKTVEIDGLKLNTYSYDYLKRIKNLYGFIYVTTNLINGKFYIGQKVFDNRSKNYLGSGTVLKKAIKKYGKENFHRDIIDIAFNQSNLDYLEVFYINRFNSINKQTWYNLCQGGYKNAGANISQTKKVVRYSLEGCPLEIYDSITNAAKKNGLGLNSIKGCCIGQQFKTIDNTTWRYYGDEFNKFSKPKKQNFEVLQYDLKMNFIKEYRSTREAERETGIDHITIIRCCKGRQKTSGGFIWKYKDESNIKHRSISKEVFQYDLEMNFIRKYPSVENAGKVNGFAPEVIRQNCDGWCSYAYGFIWQYENKEMRNNHNAKNKVM